MPVRSGNVLACIDDLSPKKHRDKHALPGAQLRHIRLLEKGTEGVIRQDSAIKSLGGSPDCALSADESIEFVDHLILTIYERSILDPFRYSIASILKR